VSKVLITSYEFSNSGIPGNCGSRVPYRLSASYIDEKGVAARYKSNSKNGKLKSIVEYNGNDLSTALRRIYKHAPSDRAIPLEWAYSDVLKHIHTGSYSIICITDTEDGQGDGHCGEFAPRYFAQWLIDKRLAFGDKVVCPRYEGEDREYNHFAWILTPNFDSITKHLKSTIKDVKEYITEYNKDPLLMKQEGEKDAEEQELKQRITAGWAGFSSGVPEDAIETNPLFRRYIEEPAERQAAAEAVEQQEWLASNTQQVFDVLTNQD